jgi:hypothetical protein
MLPKGGGAVMAQRTEPPDSLDDFPTPPWSTRALFSHVIGARPLWESVWEPACGRGLMSEVLTEHFAGQVYASDVHDYGHGYAVGSFLGEGADRAACPFQPDWVITNPPFNLAQDFLQRGLAEARIGVALLLRLAWLESQKRWQGIYSVTPPHTVAIFVERVPMHRGRWEPDGVTMTAYAWFVWQASAGAQRESRLIWIPPGQRKALEHPDDRRRFAIQDEMPLLAIAE